MTLETTLERTSRVTARVNYLAPHSERPVRYNFPPPPGVPVQSGTFSAEPVEIVDGRPLAGRFSLDRQGFVLIAHASAVAAFDDPAVVRRRYYPEAEEVVRLVTGAERVLAFDHNVRSAMAAARSRSNVAGAKVKEPVKRVHNDFTDVSGPRRATDELREAGLDPALIAGRRFALINLWRPIRGPVQDSPLALCDATTLAPGDFVTADLVYPDRVGEIHQFRHSPAHRWYYFSAMRTDEALLIKCYDSAIDGRARFTAHTAFDDPTTPPGARPRESIEVRTLVVYGKA